MYGILHITHLEHFGNIDYLPRIINTDFIHEATVLQDSLSNAIIRSLLQMI